MTLPHRLLSIPAAGAEVKVFPDAAGLSRGVAEEFREAARAAVRAQGRFLVALSGGSTPKAVYSLLAQEAGTEGGRLPWERMHLFLGDERCVAPEHPDSNFRMASEALFARVPLPTGAIHRVRVEQGPGDAARSYEAELRQVAAGAESGSGAAVGVPVFDLILLGMGTDGHTASLFPGTAALEESQALVVANRVEKLQADRITFTYPLINAAAAVWFVTAGADKASMLRNVLLGDPSGTVYPSQRVRPARGKLCWMIDEAAAAQL